MTDEEISGTNSRPPGPESSGGDQPSRIGPYRILDTLGEGGMAVVYLAEQSEPVKRRVALKILKPGMDSKQIVARFESERQALAVLDHPNIAKIFDGGMAESGRPYFVMEQVKGVPITDYCDDQRLNNEERLKVFIKVCSAVQHAHLKGLIHRDLKPSNILVAVVDGEPQPKIIDFGIAKATTTTLTEATLYTRVGQIIGTPQYMSPEQANITGLDIDTRTDIYSLGVVLYELLVGTVPLDLRAIGDQAMQLALREKDPPRPSTRFTELGDTQEEVAKVRDTDPDRLRQQLKGDLDWIVMCAIEKDRTRRYETVNALAMECRRFLKHEPVIARPPNPGYLLSRFVQRNRLVVVAGSVAILAIIAGAATATLGYIRATEAEQVARQEAETAQQVSDFLVELFEVSDPSEARGNSITAREILDRGADKISDAFESNPAVKARLLGTIGRVYESLGLYEPATSLLSSSLDIQRGNEDADPMRLAEALSRFGWLMREIGDYRAAESSFRDVLEIHRRELKAPHVEITGTLNLVAVSLMDQDRLDDALKVLEEAQGMLARIPENDADLDEKLRNNIANIYARQNRLEEAEPLYRRILKDRYIRYGEHHLLTGFAHDNLAMALEDLERLDEAEQHYRKALEILLVVFGENHPEVAQTMGNVGQFLVDRGAYDEAERLLLKAIEIHRGTIGNDYFMVADSLTTLSEMSLTRGDKNTALDYIKQALVIYDKTLPAEHSKVLFGDAVLAEVLIALGRLDEAERQLLELYGSTELESQPDNYEQVLEHLVALYTARDQPDKADEYRQLLAITSAADSDQQ